MTTSIPHRPLPAGVVDLPRLERGPGPERRETAPGGRLIIGRGIQIKGEIASCQSLIVEGRVEASLAAETLQILDGGRFMGLAEVTRADIAGTFEGTLTVHGQLSIMANGRVAGKIRYERINVEAGGEIAGNVATDSEVGDQADLPARRTGV